MTHIKLQKLQKGDHSLNGSSGSVNSDLQFLWGQANFNPIQNQYP